MSQPNASTPANPLDMADHSTIKCKFLNVRYAAGSESQAMDIYLPSKGNGPFPCIMHIHGGAFRMCDKADRQVQPWLQGVERGYVVVSINYRLSGEAIFPAGVQDCKAAIRFLRANAASYSIDPTKIAVVGGSAGGYYTVMMCVTNAQSFPEDYSLGWENESSAINCGIAWFPPTDFLQMDAQLKENSLFPQDHNDADSPESQFMGGQITTLDPAWMAQSNPLTYVDAHPTPLYIQHGRRDHLVPWQQSAMLAEKIREVAGDSYVIHEILEKADHADPLFETPENMETMFSYLDKSLQ